MARFEGLQSEIVKWADSISPRRRPQDTVVKLVSEASELLDAVLNKPEEVGQELADNFILLLDLADMHNVDLVGEAWKKMDVNRSREWVEVDGVIRRVK